MVSGRLGAVSAKYFVDTAVLLIVTGSLLVLLTDRVSVLLAPAGTLPKFSARAPKDKLPALELGFDGLDDLELNPWHPASSIMLASNPLTAAAFSRNPEMVCLSGLMAFDLGISSEESIFVKRSDCAHSASTQFRATDFASTSHCLRKDNVKRKTVAKYNTVAIFNRRPSPC